MSSRGKKIAERSLPRYFRKSTILVYTVPNIRPLARKIWNVLACIDQKDITANKSYEISFKELCWLIHYKSNDYSGIKSALLELNSKAIQSIDSVAEGEIILSEKWLNSNYFKSLKISRGIIRYQYPDLLVPEISWPKPYAYLDFDSLRRLPNNKAIILFEITGRHVKKPYYSGYYSPWSLCYFRALMGANSKTYDSYKYLNAKIISPCLQVINDLTDLEVTLVVEKKRQVRNLKFDVIRKGIPSNIYDEEESLISQMQSIGVKLYKAHELLKTYGQKAITHALKIISEKYLQGAIKGTKAAYFMGTLKKIKPSVETNKKLNDIHRKAFKNELVELREQVEKDKAIQKRLPKINEFLKTLKPIEFENLKECYLNEYPLCLSEFSDPKNWLDRICMSPVHLEIWLDHVEDYQKQQTRSV